MERVGAELLRRLLDDGWRVTVVARRCDVTHPALDFRRVRGPARPFALAYPIFLILASLLVTRRRDALLHTTGAMVLGRADVCTVHYCHRAAQKQISGTRASRPGRLYRVNAAVADWLARTAESWCYRPGRVGALCAVSSGVADELATAYPRVRNVVRTIPNGVDVAAFRPDSATRAEVRRGLGVDDGESLAVFVGGDWERKGLRFAVEALASAPHWRLAVAGPGDDKWFRETVRRAGVEDRVRLLGVLESVARLYAAADAFVLPTAYETFSLVTYEAAASGVPLLATPVSGVVDLLIPGENGWFIARDAADIAARLRQLRADPEGAAAMGERARHAARAFSWAAMHKGYVRVYADGAANRTHGRWSRNG